MRHHHQRKRGSALPPHVDPSFLQALTGRRDSTGRSSKKNNHKSEQLCRQVERVVGLWLIGACADDVLQHVHVAHVTESTGGIVVHVASPPTASVSDVLQRLARVAPRLRADVAQTVRRKRIPELHFVPAAPAGEVTP